MKIYRRGVCWYTTKKEAKKACKEEETIYHDPYLKAYRIINEHNIYAPKPQNKNSTSHLDKTFNRLSIFTTIGSILFFFFVGSLLILLIYKALLYDFLGSAIFTLFIFSSYSFIKFIDAWDETRMPTKEYEELQR